MFFWGLVLGLFLFTNSCFAYDLKPFAQQIPGKPGKSINIVFCSLNYKRIDDLAKDSQMLIQRLKTAKPFDEYGHFKFWSITLSPKEEADIFKPTSDFPPLGVRSDLLADISAKVQGAYKLVIIDAQGFSHCAELSQAGKDSLIVLGRYAASKDRLFANAFLHELGHSFGLRDESVISPQRSPEGYPNCATSKAEAEKWWGDLASGSDRVGYFSGCCGNMDYTRPTIASLMNDFRRAEDFGPVNERYLREALEKFES
jgi:hypothetical protein